MSSRAAPKTRNTSSPPGVPRTGRRSTGNPGEVIGSARRRPLSLDHACKKREPAAPFSRSLRRCCSRSLRDACRAIRASRMLHAMGATVRRRGRGAFGMMRGALCFVRCAWAGPDKRADVGARSSTCLCARGGGCTLADGARRRGRLGVDCARAASDCDGGEEADKRSVHGELSFCWRPAKAGRTQPANSAPRAPVGLTVGCPIPGRSTPTRGIGGVCETRRSGQCRRRRERSSTTWGGAGRVPLSGKILCSNGAGVFWARL